MWRFNRNFLEASSLITNRLIADTDKTEFQMPPMLLLSMIGFLLNAFIGFVSPLEIASVESTVVIAVVETLN